MSDRSEPGIDRFVARSVPYGRTARRAFSLTELLIALIILGFGLLVVGAALPLGAQKTRESTNLAIGDAATQYMLDLLEFRLKLGSDPRHDTVFRPRDTSAPYAPAADSDPDVVRPYEPWIKVRPLNIQSAHFSDAENTRWGRKHGVIAYQTALIEEMIRQVVLNADEAYQGALVQDNALGNDGLGVEFLFDDGNITVHREQFDFDGIFDNGAASFWGMPALSFIEGVYPPVPGLIADTDDEYRPDLDADGDGDYGNELEFELLYLNRENSPAWYDDTASRAEDRIQRLAMTAPEVRMAAERNVSFVVFYRRVSYAPDANPRKFEFIVVAVRRATENHRFALPASIDDAEEPFPNSINNDSEWEPAEPEWLERNDVPIDSLLPVPVLVTLDPNGDTPGGNVGFDWLEAGSPNEIGQLNGGDYIEDLTNPNFDSDQYTYSGRELNSTFRERQQLVFRVTEDVADILPPGSIMIPAVNDDQLSGLRDSGGYFPNRPAGVRQFQLTGFVPHSPTNLPIYTVLERLYDRDGATIIVRGNGTYPWTSEDGLEFAGSLDDELRVALWPFWVIPPSFEEFIVENGRVRPLFDERSPVVGISSRVITLPEVEELIDE